MNDNIVPKFVVKNERNDVSTQARVQQLANGFVVRTGNMPIHYPSIEAAAEAVKEGLIRAAWEGLDSSHNKDE